MVITLCRINDNKELERETNDYELSAKKYWAVSYMWCDATWLKIPGIASEVLASPQKAKFIRSILLQIVGTKLFWMDVLSVDQSYSASRRAVAGNIPEIYSNANVTLIIRKCEGFTDCCDQLLLSADPTRSTFEVMPQVDTLAVRHLYSCIIEPIYRSNGFSVYGHFRSYTCPEPYFCDLRDG